MPSFSYQQCRAGRALLGWSAEDLAREANVGVATVRRYETGNDARQSSIDAMRAALEAAGLRFIGPRERSDDGGQGVRQVE